MSRRQYQAVFEGHSRQANGERQRAPQHVLHPEADLQSMGLLSSHAVMERKLTAQVAEIERFLGENRRLATTNLAMGQDINVARQEVKRLKEHIQSIQAESDIQIRVLMDKIAKSEAGTKADESLKKDLEQAHSEMRKLIAAKQELTVKIERDSQELQNARADAEKLPDMQAELEIVRKEHHKLRVMFEYEKGLNIEEVRVMQAMEKNMIGMVREMEKLRAEISNVEKRAHVPKLYSEGYMNPNSSYQPPVHGGSAYSNGNGMHYVQLGVGALEKERNSYGSSSGPEAGKNIGNEAHQSASGTVV